MSGFVVRFQSSQGDDCFLVSPGRVGQGLDGKYPWARATYVATAFATQENAKAALDQMKSIHAYIAPECNGGLFKRLTQAQVVPVDQVTGIEIEIP